MHHLFCLFYFFLPALYFCILVSSSFSIQRMFFVFNCGPCFFTQICICVPGLHTVSERLLRFSSPNLLNFHGFFSVADHALYIMIEVPYCHTSNAFIRVLSAMMFYGDLRWLIIFSMLYYDCSVFSTAIFSSAVVFQVFLAFLLLWGFFFFFFIMNILLLYGLVCWLFRACMNLWLVPYFRFYSDELSDFSIHL